MNKSNTQIFCYTEIWYLVKYEDDENLRVLAEDEIRHIFPDEEEAFCRIRHYVKSMQMLCHKAMQNLC